MENKENTASTEENARPAWMEDPLVKDIPEKKMRFLEELFTSGHGKSQKEMMAFLMPMMKAGRPQLYSSGDECRHSRHSETQQPGRIAANRQNPGKKQAEQFPLKKSSRKNLFLLDFYADQAGACFTPALPEQFSQHTQGI